MNQPEAPATGSPLPRRRKPVVGLIGAIGSGKSRAAAEFARRGARMISGDALGHEALRQPDIKAAVVHRWGDEILDASGEVERRKVARIVFGDSKELHELETLVFPYIERRLAEEVALAQQDPNASLVIVDAAVMLEAGWDKHCDWLVYVHAPRSLRLQRVAAQRGWTEREVNARSRSQLPLTEKVARADFVLDNSGSAEMTARGVEALLQAWAKSPPRSRFDRQAESQ